MTGLSAHAVDVPFFGYGACGVYVRGLGVLYADQPPGCLVPI